MALNLSRNSRLWVSTVTSGHDNSNTFEIPLQPDFSFSQGMSFEDISPEEAGPVPVRGSKRFNSALDPVDWSFSTYLNPYIFGGSNVMAVDAILWHALATSNDLSPDFNGDGSGNPGTTDVYYSPTSFNVGFTKNSAHVLTELNLYFKIDNKVYHVKKAQVNQADIPLDISGIGMTNWAGQATEIEEITAPAFMSGTGLAFDDSTPTNDEFVAIPSNAVYLLNKLTTVSMQSDVSGSNANYTIGLTGGSLTISNNITYVTPTTLANVDTPIGSFTGTFDVSGTMESYLKDGVGSANGTSSSNAYGSADLLKQMLSNRSVVNSTNIVISINGEGSTSKVVVTLPQAQIAIPSMSVDSIVSQSFEFKGIPSSADMDDGDEVDIKFYTA